MPITPMPSAIDAERDAREWVEGAVVLGTGEWAGAGAGAAIE
jgi:hypothetical protein